MQVVKLSALPALCVDCNVAFARRLHSYTPVNLDMINGGNYHMFPSVIGGSSYLPSLDLIGKAPSDYRSWHKWGSPGSPADAPEPLVRRFVPQGTSPSSSFLVILVRDECNNAGWSGWRSVKGCLIGAKAR